MGGYPPQDLHGQEVIGQDIFDYIEMFYNPKRRHRCPKRLSPAEVE
jgi:hypothetical protein